MCNNEKLIMVKEGEGAREGAGIEGEEKTAGHKCDVDVDMNLPNLSLGLNQDDDDGVVRLL